MCAVVPRILPIFRVVHHLSAHRAFPSEQQKKQEMMLTPKSILVY